KLIFQKNFILRSGKAVESFDENTERIHVKKSFGKSVEMHIEDKVVDSVQKTWILKMGEKDSSWREERKVVSKPETEEEKMEREEIAAKVQALLKADESAFISMGKKNDQGQFIVSQEKSDALKSALKEILHVPPETDLRFRLDANGSAYTAGTLQLAALLGPEKATIPISLERSGKIPLGKAPIKRRHIARIVKATQEAVQPQNRAFYFGGMTGREDEILLITSGDKGDPYVAFFGRPGAMEQMEADQVHMSRSWSFQFQGKLPHSKPLEQNDETNIINLPSKDERAKGQKATVDGLELIPFE
ncbi:MAG: hypothetical protein AAB853_01870, partial [Patescibacteria group bacterium]